MCGLVGMAGNIMSNEKKMFKDMLIFDQVRGMDSTGIALIKGTANKNGKRFDVDKEVGPPSNLWDWGYSSLFTPRGIVEGWPYAIIGHNRAATTGKVNRENAHPFIIGDIVGVHNGSLRAYKELAGSDEYEVDSQAIFNDIDINGIEHTWKSFVGAAALVYWNDKDETLNFIRNDERPLVFAENEKKDVLYWASEAWMIQVAAMRSGVKLTRNEKGDIVYRSLPTDILHTYKIKATGYDLKSSQKLEKKFTAPATEVGKNSSGGATRKTTDHVREALAKFKPNKKWKDRTDSCDLDIKEVDLTNIRWIRRADFKGMAEDNVFRLDVRQDGKIVGQLDIHPMNKPEMNKLLKIVDEVRNGQQYKYELVDNPRKESITYKPVMDRYLCTASSVRFEKGNVVGFVPLSKLHKDKPVPKERSYLDAKGNLVGKDSIIADLKRAGDCCCYCQTSIEFKDVDKISWVDSNSPLCSECSTNWGGNLHMLNGGR